MIINLTPLGKPFYKLSNIQYSTDGGNNWNIFPDGPSTNSYYYESFYKNEGINNKGWLLVIKNNLKIRFTKPLKKMPTLYLIGGGGGGGSGDSTNPPKTNEGGGGGGQGGQVVEKSPDSFSLLVNTEYNISIGSGGIGSINHSEPTDGGDTSFDSFSASGGTAGSNSNKDTGTEGVGGGTANEERSGGKGGSINADGNPGQNGKSLTFDLFPNCQWSGKTYGSGGGGGPGGEWKNYAEFGNKGIINDGMGLNQQNGGNYSGGKGSLPVYGSKKLYGNNNDGYYFEPTSLNGREVIYVNGSTTEMQLKDNIKATDGLSNYGGGGGGGGTFNFSNSSQKFVFYISDDNKITTDTQVSSSSSSRAKLLYLDMTPGANGGSGVCILYYKE